MPFIFRVKCEQWQQVLGFRAEKRDIGNVGAVVSTELQGFSRTAARRPLSLFSDADLGQAFLGAVL